MGARASRGGSGAPQTPRAVTSITIRRQGGRVLLYADDSEVAAFAVCDELGRSNLVLAVLRLLSRLIDSAEVGG